MAKPFIKWAGGKEKELCYIIPKLPKDINNYIEPFLGGGAVFLAFDNIKISGEKFVNDFSQELIALYNAISSNDKKFFNYLKDIEHNWNLLSVISEKYSFNFLEIYNAYKVTKNKQELKDSISEFMLHHSNDFNGMLEMSFNRKIDEFNNEIIKCLYRKIVRVCKLEDENGDFGSQNVLENIETALKSAFYTHIRTLYNEKETPELKKFFNPSRKSAFFYFIREYCYAAMFRYNNKGEFNVPYGGMAYNRKNFKSKIEYISSKALVDYIQETKIYNLDFEEFINSLNLETNDFIFVDPPYDTEFSDYAQNEFNKKDQIRLADCLARIDAKIMIVIKDTPFIRKLYKERHFKISEFEKKYMVNFQNRNDRQVSHLLITNY